MGFLFLKILCESMINIDDELDVIHLNDNNQFVYIHISHCVGFNTLLVQFLPISNTKKGIYRSL